MPELVPAKTLEESKAWLKDNISVWLDKGGVCWGRARYIDEDIEIGRSHTACHSWVGYAYGYACCGMNYDAYWGEYSQVESKYTKDAKDFLVLTCHSRRNNGVSTKEACDFLVRWVAHESPFSQYILNRDDDDSLIDGGLVLFCGPHGLRLAEALWICKVLRLVTEGAHGPDTFMTLVQGGVDPMLALFVASHVRLIRGAKFGYTGVDGHSTVVDSRLKTSLRGLLDRNVDTRASNTHTLFKPISKKTEVPNAHETVAKFCQPVVKSDGWGGEIRAKEVSKDDLIAQVLQWQEELLGTTRKPILPGRDTIYLEADM